MRKIIKDAFSFSKHLVFTAILFGTTTTLNAASLYYSFEGTITSFDSFNDSVALSDFDVELGQTAVSYVFEVDFDRNVSSSSNSAGTWHRFYSDLLVGGIVNGENGEDNESYNVYFNDFNYQGRMQGGSRVDIWTTNDITTSWEVEEWYIGQQLRVTDGGYLSTGTGGAVYFFGDVELTSISTTNPIPLPGALILFTSAMAFLGFTFRRKQYRL